MNNIKIKKNKITTIKKGIFSKFSFQMYIFFNIILIITTSILLQNEVLSWNSSIFIFIEIEVMFFVIYLLVVSISQFFVFYSYENFFLETIEIDTKLKNLRIRSEKLDVSFSFLDLEKIEVNFREDFKNIYKATFQELCTLTFKIKDNIEYKWGFRISQQKGEELKELIEKEIFYKN